MRLIDADDLKDVIWHNVYLVQDVYNSRDSGMFWTGGIERAIDEAPTIDAGLIKIGHWIEKGKGIAECDVCNRQNLYRQDGIGVLTKYCPYCGARMEW